MAFAVRPKQTLSMQTRDGVRLDADVYYPEADGEFPVLLMRQPYGRAIASTVVYAHPTWYAAQGYIVVIQDVRGRGTSAGEFDLFAHEVADGEDSVNWAADLLQSNGHVGMYGFSYQGMTQLFAAAKRPPALKTICPAMVAYDLYADWAYEGGAFCYQANLGWAIQLATETARRQGDAEAFATLYAAARQLPLHNPVHAVSGILRRLAPESHYHAWLEHFDPHHPYWELRSPRTYLHGVDLPILHIGGWFDTYLRGTLKLYQAMQTQSPQPQHLIIGPWAHLPWGRRVGPVDYGPAAVSPVDRLQLRWFDQFLKGQDTGLLAEPPVQLFEMGSNQWRLFQAFPGQNVRSFFLSSNGLGAVDETAGQLSRVPSGKAATDVLVHDPWRPVPSLGGHASTPAGQVDRSSLDSRTDVVTYTSAPLSADLHLAGAITVQLYCTTDAISFDLCAVLSEQTAEGQVLSLSQGYQRIDRSTHAQADRDTTPYTIALQPTCVRISAGSAIRLSLSAACFPAYGVNPGTGAPPTESRLIDAQVITLMLASGGDRPSQIQLPIVDGSEAVPGKKPVQPNGPFP